MICKEYLALIPGYLDGELSDAQAAPLRRHLIDCQSCRNAASGEKSLKRWFEHDPGADVEVPLGFAPRVARRAFAGDTGFVGDTGEAPMPARAEGESTPILKFVLGITAAAAALLLALSAWMHSVHLPDGENIHAVEYPTTIEEVLERMDRTNAASPVSPEAGVGDFERESQDEEGSEESGE